MPFLVLYPINGILMTTLWVLSAFFIWIYNKHSHQCITFGAVVRILVRRKKDSKEKDVCLPGATCWHRKELHSVLPFNASEGYALGQQTHGLPSWLEITTPIAITGSGSKHTALLGGEVHHAGRASPKLWSAAGTLLGDKCQGVLDDWGPSCWQGHTRCQACTQVLHLNLTP